MASGWLRLLLILLVVLWGAAYPVGAHEGSDDRQLACVPAHSHKGVKAEITIKASPRIVWQGMQEQRKMDPDSHALKTTKVGEKGAELEQKFVFPSPFGDAECWLQLIETTGERVDYFLKESEDLKAMEGSWVLTPIDEGKATVLSLTSYVEPNICVPRVIVNAIIHAKVQHNLNMVKKLAEASSEKTAGRKESLQ